MGKEVEYAMKQLTGKIMRDSGNAYNALLGTSAKSDEVYGYMDDFFAMMNDGNSNIRVRALGLICANAKWDGQKKIDGRIDEILSHITDEKPIAARQFINLLPELAAEKPELKTVILDALKNADFSVYPDGMSALAAKDAASAAEKIEAGAGEKKKCVCCDDDDPSEICKRFGVSF